jgi:hypothetical protein
VGWYVLSRRAQIERRSLWLVVSRFRIEFVLEVKEGSNHHVTIGDLESESNPSYNRARY